MSEVNKFLLLVVTSPLMHGMQAHPSVRSARSRKANLECWIGTNQKCTSVSSPLGLASLIALVSAFQASRLPTLTDSCLLLPDPGSTAPLALAHPRSTLSREAGQLYIAVCPSHHLHSVFPLPPLAIHYRRKSVSSVRHDLTLLSAA